jgi:hypothetical protein
MRSLGLATTLAAVFMCMPTADAQMTNTLTAEEQKEGWTLLFDGKTLNGWTQRGDAKWDVQNGEIVAQVGDAQGHLATAKPYGDFRLRFEIFVDGAANSGAFLRVPETGAIGSGNAYEVNVFDKSPSWPSGSINEIAKTAGTPNTVGKWNTYEITAQGDHLVAVLNGQTTVDTRVPAEALAKRQTRGPIALQYGGGKGTVKFRNVRILVK